MKMKTLYVSISGNGAAATVPRKQVMAVHTYIREAMYQSTDFHFQLKKHKLNSKSA